MKKMLLLGIICLMAEVGFSQNKYRPDEKLDNLVLAVNLVGPELVTRELYLELDLNEKQCQQVQEINQVRYQEIMDAEETYKLDPVLLSRVTRNINFEKDKAITKLLSKNQVQAFVELDEQRSMILLSEIE